MPNTYMRVGFVTVPVMAVICVFAVTNFDPVVDLWGVTWMEKVKGYKVSTKATFAQVH
jgi:hypothetical protein